MRSGKLLRALNDRAKLSLEWTRSQASEEGGAVRTNPGGIIEAPTEYPAKLYVRNQAVRRFPGDDTKELIGERSVLPQLVGDRETEVAVYQLVRVAKFKRVVTEVIESGETSFKKLTTEIVEEV